MIFVCLFVSFVCLFFVVDIVAVVFFVCVGFFVVVCFYACLFFFPVVFCLFDFGTVAYYSYFKGSFSLWAGLGDNLLLVRK